MRKVPRRHLARISCTDLEEIGYLEGYIERSQNILVYCSRGYFDSKNCMRELAASTQQKQEMMLAAAKVIK